MTVQEREAAFLAGQGDALAIYRMKSTPPSNGYVPLERLRKSGESPLAGHYDLLHVVPLAPGADLDRTLDTFRKATMLKPGDIAAFKQDGAVVCWYVDLLAYSRMNGMLENYLKTAEMGCEQNYNQIDGVINNIDNAISNGEPKPSVLDCLHQWQRETEKFRDGTAPPAPHRDPER